MYDHSARLDRDTALMLWTQGSAWFSSEQGNQKGQIKVGQLADLAVLSKDYFRVPEEEIKGIESVLTVVDGDIVYAAGQLWPAGAAGHSGAAGVVAGGQGAGPLPQRAAAGGPRRSERRPPLQRPVRGSQPPARFRPHVSDAGVRR